jgi:mRNA interferase RelE/StbE
MKYLVKFTPQAEKDLLCIDKAIAINIANKIDWLSQNIESIILFPLKGKFKGKYKLRVGEWRIVYSVDYSVLYAIRHRREVYKI